VEPKKRLRPQQSNNVGAPTLFSGTPVINRIGAVVAVVAMFIYIVAIVLGRIPAQQKLGVPDIAIVILTIGIAIVLLRPKLLDRIRRFKFGELELDWLQKLEENQKKQGDELDDVRFVLTLLLQPNERAHLRNLETGTTMYEGNEAVCAELRKLRTLGLIRNQKDRAIAETAAKRNFDLKDVVELTDRGRQYLERLGEYDEPNTTSTMKTNSR
jgi:hypothetical protein